MVYVVPGCLAVLSGLQKLLAVSTSDCGGVLLSRRKTQHRKGIRQLHGTISWCPCIFSIWCAHDVQMLCMSFNLAVELRSCTVQVEIQKNVIRMRNCYICTSLLQKPVNWDGNLSYFKKCKKPTNTRNKIRKKKTQFRELVFASPFLATLRCFNSQVSR